MPSEAQKRPSNDQQFYAFKISRAINDITSTEMITTILSAYTAIIQLQKIVTIYRYISEYGEILQQYPVSYFCSGLAPLFQGHKRKKKWFIMLTSVLQVFKWRAKRQTFVRPCVNIHAFVFVYRYCPWHYRYNGLLYRGLITMNHFLHPEVLIVDFPGNPVWTRDEVYWTKDSVCSKPLF